jgi:hypothetical protein
MKNFFRGLLTAFAGFMLIAVMLASLAALVGIWFLEGYVAIAAFIGATSVLGVDILVLYKIGKGGAYAKDSV